MSKLATIAALGLAASLAACAAQPPTAAEIAATNYQNCLGARAERDDVDCGALKERYEFEASQEQLRQTKRAAHAASSAAAASWVSATRPAWVWKPAYPTYPTVQPYRW